MVQVSFAKEITVETPNTVGIAAKLAGLVANQAKANISAAWAAGHNSQGHFSLITDNNQKVLDVLKKEYPKAQEQDVLIFNVSNEPGQISEITNKIGGAGININYLFTTYYQNQPAIVLSTSDDKKALALFK
ncbi:MAG: hypothetical protein SFW66_10120 [Gammaproteobacteria bacterium]|nr:hypothetical protein [Gammaproteobacteria bacterium]